MKPFATSAAFDVANVGAGCMQISAKRRPARTADVGPSAGPAFGDCGTVAQPATRATISAVPTVFICRMTWLTAAAPNRLRRLCRVAVDQVMRLSEAFGLATLHGPANLQQMRHYMQRGRRQECLLPTRSFLCPACFTLLVRPTSRFAAWVSRTLLKGDRDLCLWSTAYRKTCNWSRILCANPGQAWAS